MFYSWICMLHRDGQLDRVSRFDGAGVRLPSGREHSPAARTTAAAQRAHAQFVSLSHQLNAKRGSESDAEAKSETPVQDATPAPLALQLAPPSQVACSHVGALRVISAILYTIHGDAAMLLLYSIRFKVCDMVMHACY